MVGDYSYNSIRTSGIKEEETAAKETVTKETAANEALRDVLSHGIFREREAEMVSTSIILYNTI